MTKRLFVVVNPTHYLNAVEYVHNQGSQEDHLVIMTFFTKGISALDDLGASDCWKSIRFLDYSKIKDLNSDGKFWSVSRSFILKAYHEILPDHLVMGNLIDNLLYPSVLSVKNKVQKITSLDDGTPTLNIAKNRYSKDFYKCYHVNDFNTSIKKLVYLKLFTPFIQPPKHIEFFSIFNLTLPNTDKLTVNNYCWTRSKVKDLDCNKQAVFIGSHIVDRNIITEEDYFQSLSNIKEEVNNEGYEFVYVHHRGESQKIKERLQRTFKTIEFNLPLELAYININRPELFLGHFSTSLFTLSRIYPKSKVRGYLFENNRIIGTKFEPKEYIIMVQESLEKDNLIFTRYLENN